MLSYLPDGHNQRFKDIWVEEQVWPNDQVQAILEAEGFLGEEAPRESLDPDDRLETVEPDGFQAVLQAVGQAHAVRQRHLSDFIYKWWTKSKTEHWITAVRFTYFWLRATSLPHPSNYPYTRTIDVLLVDLQTTNNNSSLVKLNDEGEFLPQGKNASLRTGC